MVYTCLMCYHSINSIPAITISLSSYISSHQPPVISMCNPWWYAGLLYVAQYIVNSGCCVSVYCTCQYTFFTQAPCLWPNILQLAGTAFCLLYTVICDFYELNSTRKSYMVLPVNMAFYYIHFYAISYCLSKTKCVVGQM